MSSLRFSRSGSSTPARSSPTRIVLIDNTAANSSSPSRAESPTPPSEDDNAQPPRRSGDGKRQVLRKAIAERKYRRWKPGSEGEREELPDERADRVVVERAGEGEEENGAAVDGAGDRDQGVAAGTVRKGKKKKKQEAEIAEIDVLYENQRGAFFCGIPLFSSKSLLNFDPAPWQNGLFHDSPVSIVDAQVPDPSWVWAWKSWYVDMTADVDEEGWAYSFSFSPAFAWHGNHVWFHSFVRRRRWLRKRVKLPPRLTKEILGQGGEYYGSTIDGSVERAGHGLNDDYFTIHSRRDHTKKKRKKKSVLDGSDWGGEDSSDEEVEVKDVATLMKVVRKARLDREKIEAIMIFVENGGEEVEYLAEKLPELMRMMIFQASRRQLLAHLESYTAQYEAGEVPTITIRSSSPGSASLQKADASEPDTVVECKSPSEDSPSTRARKIESLKKAAAAADQEVKKMEFWSDVKDVVRKGESVGAEAEQEGWGELGISGASMGNEKLFDGAGNGGEKVDKGKGKEVVR